MSNLVKHFANAVQERTSRIKTQYPSLATIQGQMNSLSCDRQQYHFIKSAYISR